MWHAQLRTVLDGCVVPLTCGIVVAPPNARAEPVEPSEMIFELGVLFFVLDLTIRGHLPQLFIVPLKLLKPGLNLCESVVESS